jgi:hypothetical protein
VCPLLAGARYKAERFISSAAIQSEEPRQVNIFLFDAFCAVLIVAGLLIAFKKRPLPPGERSGDGAANDARTYARRITGVMLMSLGLALAVIFTAFYYA